MAFTAEISEEFPIIFSSLFLLFYCHYLPGLAFDDFLLYLGGRKDALAKQIAVRLAIKIAREKFSKQSAARISKFYTKLYTFIQNIIYTKICTKYTNMYKEYNYEMLPVIGTCIGLRRYEAMKTNVEKSKE